MENPAIECLSVSYDAPALMIHPLPRTPRLETLLDQTRAWAEGYYRGEAFARAEEEAAFAGFLTQESPCGIHLFRTGRLTCPICARERARIRLGFYDRVSDDEEA